MYTLFTYNMHAIFIYNDETTKYAVEKQEMMTKQDRNGVDVEMIVWYAH